MEWRKDRRRNAKSDLFDLLQAVSLAVDFVLPYALSRPNLKVEPVWQCLKQKIEDVYEETAGDDNDDSVLNTDVGALPSHSAYFSGDSANGKGDSLFFIASPAAIAESSTMLKTSR